MKRSMKRYLAMLLAMTLVLQQGGTITLADEKEPASEVVTEKTTEAKAPEKKAEVNKPEETKEPESKVPETKPEAPKTEENKTSESKQEETNAPDAQTGTQTDDATAEPESNSEKATEQVTESETATDGATEGETQTAPEQEKESGQDSEPETEKKEEAQLEVSVMQEVFQKTVDDATVPMVKYTVKLANKTETADAEGATLKVLLADALSYKKEEGETPELISFENLGKAIEATAFAGEELNEEQKTAYANGNVVLWKDQTVAAGAEKTFVFCAEVKDGQMDVDALKNLWLVNGKAVAKEKIQWANTELLKVEEELPAEFTYEDDDMIVTATLAEGTVLPEGAQFVVEKVELSEEEKAQVEEAAEKKQLANYAAYDMHFELDGEEVEPQGEVAVKVEYKEANAEDFGGETLNTAAAGFQVIHLNEQSGAEDVTAGAEVDTEGAVSSAEFVTNSFSIFVLSQMVDEDHTFVYEDDDVKITAVTSEEEELLNPNLTELKLEIIEDRESKEYKELEKAIEKKEKDNENLLGLRAYKFTFLKDDEEVEPTGEIEVKIEHKTSSIPEYIQENLVSKTSFYQATEKGKVKELDAKLKSGRNHSVKEAEMTTGEVMLIEALEQEGTKMSRSEILAGLGIAQNFAVFAEELTNNMHMEGTIAVHKLVSSTAEFTNTDNTYNNTNYKLELIVEKTAVGLEKQKTYRFGIFNKNDSGNYQRVAINDLEKGIIDGIFIIQTDESGKGKKTIGDLDAGTYYVFELDDSDQPIVKDGEATVNDQNVTVEYEFTEVGGSFEGEGVANTSYIQEISCGQDSITMLVQSSKKKVKLVFGSGITVSEGEPGYQDIQWEYQGSEQKFTILKNLAVIETADPFPINFETEFGRLKNLAKQLVDVMDLNVDETDPSSENVKVIHVSAQGGTLDWRNATDNRGEQLFQQENDWLNNGLNFPGLLVINVDCSGAGDNLQVDGIRLNGSKDGWDPNAHNVIWNFGTYNNTLDLNETVGTILAPDATVTQMSSICGAVIADKVLRIKQGPEIHHVPLLETEGKITKHVKCKNTAEEVKVGDLKVSKTVTGANGDKTKYFTFTVTLGDTTINGTFGDMDFTNGVATFTLKHGETKTATGLPADITYTVTETEANKDDYTTTVSGDTGTIEAGRTATAVFINKKGESKGDLEVEKTVTGDGGDQTKDFNFTVTLSNKTITGVYGDMLFTNGVASFTLHHGETKKATGLPADITYTVTETEADKDGYTTNATGATGTIADGAPAKAAFVNNKIKKGSLEVSKKVKGNAGDTKKDFHFTVTLDDTTINGTYGDMTFTNGVASFTLKDDETKTATDLPVGSGLGYTVAETEANQGDYTTDATGATGTITDGGTAKAVFVNKAFTTTLSLEAQKVMADGTKPDAGTYEFELTGDGLTKPVTASNDAEGNVNFGTFTYTQKDVGSKTYTVKEIIKTADGTIYDETLYTVTVTISLDEANGTLKAEKKIEKGGKEVSAIEFTNDETHLSIEKVDGSGAALVGAKLIIKDADGKPVDSWTTDGKAHEITGLAPGTYTLSELEAPKGYQVSKDVLFEIKGNETKDAVLKVTMKDEPLKPTSRSLRVTKELSMEGISPEAHIIVKSATYYVALFEDEARTSRVSDVKKIVFANQESSYATFKDLEADKTYYIGETDEYGTLIPNGKLSPDLFYYPTYGADATFTFKGDTTEGLAGFTNVYVEWPDYFYLSGQLTVTKKVLLGGEECDSDDVFYARVFNDARLRDPVSDEVLVLDMAGGSRTSVTVTNLPIGDKPGSSRKYYVAETDEYGNPLDPDEVTEYTISVDKSEITLDASSANPEVVITNDFHEEESEFESESEVDEKKTAPKTGDDTDFAKYLFLLALSTGLGATALGQKRRKAKRVRK